MGPTSYLIPFTQTVPLWRCEVFNSRVHRNLWFPLAAAAVLAIAGCSDSATSKPATTAKKADTPKPAAAASKAPQPATMVTVPKGTETSATRCQTPPPHHNHATDPPAP